MYMNNTILLSHLHIGWDTYDRFHHEIDTQFESEPYGDGVMLFHLEVDESVADSSDVEIIQSLIR